MPQALLTAQPGLFTSPNPFGSSPREGLAVADNCLISEAGLLTSRRGIARHSALSGGSRLTSYLSTLIGLAGTSLEKYSAGWSAFAGSYSPPSGAPMRFLQVVKRLLFTTSVGVQALESLTSTPHVTGVTRPTQPLLSVVTGTGATWFTTGTQVAYRFVLGIVDATDHVIEGPPTAPIILQNTSGSTKAVNILFDFLPTWMRNTNLIIRAYRSRMTVDLTAPPSDELSFAVEHQLTATEIANGLCGFNDTTAEDRLGAALYTNATQQGISQENDAPPMALDLCYFKGTTIYANTTDKNRLLIQLLQVNQPYGMKSGDTIVITSVNGSDTYTAGAAENVATKTFLYNSTSVLNTVLSFCRIVNQQVSPTVLVRADSQATDTPTAGLVLIEDLALGQVGWTVSFSAQPQALITTGTSLTRAGSISPTTGTVTVNMNAAHTFVVGDLVDLENTATPDANFPVGIKTVASVPTGSSWTYPESGANVTSANHTYTATRVTTREWLPTDARALTSDNSADPAGLTYSKFNQPEATPFENSDTAGEPDQPIYRVLPLRDSVLILKADGVYKLNGSTPADFTITPYDLTTLLVWPESAVAMDDVALFMSQRGPVSMGESSGAFPLGPAGLDCPIKQTLLALLTKAPTAFSKAFGVAYASERLYVLWTPTVDGDANATQAWVFNTGQLAWMRWPIAATAGIVDPVTGKLVYVDGTDVLWERKDYASTDYQDIGGTAAITNVANSTTITMAGPGKGDVITQGVNVARVVSVAGGNVLTLDTAGTWTLAPATYARAILNTGTYLPWAGGEEDSGAFHQFQELAFNFRLLQAPNLTVTSFTDMDPTADQAVILGRPTQPANVNIRAGFSRNKGSGVALSAGFIHQAALCNFELQSTSLVYRPISTRTPYQKSG